MKILFVNELPPNDKRIGAVRMREFAKAIAKLGHHTILFTASKNNTEITDPASLPSLISKHNWPEPLNIQCGFKKSF